MCYKDFSIKVVLYETLDDLWGHTSGYEKLVSSYKRLGVIQIIFRRKYDFEILRLPYLTFNGLWGYTSYHNVSNNIILLQNRFINICARKKKAKIP